MTSASAAEEHALLVARLYECRKTLRFLHGEKYGPSVQRWQETILSTRPEGVAVISHTIALAERADDIACTLWLLAALVEILEAKES
jgi:hypothetical protein